MENSALLAWLGGALRKSDFDMPQSPALATRTPPPGMSDFNLYATAVLIWGSTWLAIKFQLGVVHPAVSVVWRYAWSMRKAPSLMLSAP